MPSSDFLQVIPGGATETVASGVTLATEPLPVVMRRPGEHRELHSFPDGAPLARIRAAARKRGLDTETAIAVTIERSHVAGQLLHAGAPHLVSLLDQRSRQVRADGELWSAHGSYLQHLLGLRPGATSDRPLRSPRVSLPVRLIDRVGDARFEMPTEPETELASAIAWEIAAVVAGLTITEWSFRTLALESIDRS